MRKIVIKIVQVQTWKISLRSIKKKSKTNVCSLDLAKKVRSSYIKLYMLAPQNVKFSLQRKVLQDGKNQIWKLSHEKVSHKKHFFPALSKLFFLQKFGFYWTNFIVHRFINPEGTSVMKQKKINVFLFSYSKNIKLEIFFFSILKYSPPGVDAGLHPR